MAQSNPERTSVARPVSNKKAGRSGGGNERPVGEVLRGGGETLLHRRRISLSAGGRGALIALRVAHQVHIDPAILTPALSGLVRLNRLVLAQSNDVNLVGRDGVLRGQILNHSIGTALA